MIAELMINRPIDSGVRAVGEKSGEQVAAPLSDCDPTPEDQAWWAEHCDHSEWPCVTDLSPEEQCLEALTMSETEYRMGLVTDWPW